MEEIKKALVTKEGETIWLTQKGKKKLGQKVSEMQFEWTIK